jgi:hypothetical protein
MFFLLPIFSSFGFNWLPLLEHLLFQLLIANGKASITLTNMLSILNNLDVIVALQLTSLVLNTLCTSNFLGHSLYLCSTFKQIIQG